MRLTVCVAGRRCLERERKDGCGRGVFVGEADDG